MEDWRPSEVHQWLGPRPRTKNLPRN